MYVADRWRVTLTGEYPGYINAVFVNVSIITDAPPKFVLLKLKELHTITLNSVQGYKQKRAFIMAQGPMESTCRDFWKIVHERQCGAIVMLSRLREKGKVFELNSGADNHKAFNHGKIFADYPPVALYI